eukprot:TRINITY_DN1130_c0_g1_i4.p1 TRINITY_DN1130_c0_g1~~TRINITY_DN1130_c0_g1_i4.p1  ORF type:complete len:203 (-),score=47.43 TRINITY_DN1130_c0_g1_i4:31-639(-)
MVNALNSFDNVVYEVINEPEWAVEGSGTTNEVIPVSQMQRFVAMIAEAVHTHSKAAITVGSASLKWDSTANPPAVNNYWDDANLKAAYPSSSGHLDFYQIHYYDWMYNPDWGYDPCRKNAAFWKLDKPTIVGELPATGGTHYTPSNFMTCTFNNGFYGSVFWSYNADFSWTAAAPALKQFGQNHEQIASYQALVNWLKNLRL